MSTTPTRFGDTGPVFGLADESTGFIQSFNQKRVFEKATAEDAKGNTVTSSYFNPKWEGTFELIDKNGASLPTVVTSSTISNLTTISKAIIFEWDRKPEQKGYQKSSFSFETWDAITL